MPGRRNVRIACGLVLGVVALCQVASTPVSADGPGPAYKPLAVRPLPVHVTQAAAPAQSPSAERALLNRYCVTCHNERRPTPAGAPLMLDKLNVDEIGHDPAVWEKVVRKLRSGAMPPAGLPRPDPAALTSWVESVEASLDKLAAAKPNPGRPAPVHRLNRAEYANAVRDLLGIEVVGSELLPADDSGYGFDNIGDVLSVSPGLLERYMLAAAKISRQALGAQSMRPVTTTFSVSPYLVQDDRLSEDLPFGSRGGIAVRHHFPLDAEYAIKVTTEGPGEQQQIEVRIDRRLVGSFTLGQDTLETRIKVPAGTRLLGVSFVGALDRSLPVDGRPAGDVAVTSFEYVQSAITGVQVTGPYNGELPRSSNSRDKVFVCQPASSGEEAACARKILTQFTRRAYRRPVNDRDLQPLMEVYETGRKAAGFESGIARGIEAVLVSPKFLFRVEQDPATVPADGLHRLTPLELASRLSFFLWSSIPDDQLLDAAVNGSLNDRQVLDREVRRMLADPRASALVTNFGGQWLYLRNLRTAAPNATLFPEFDDNLRQAFQRETELLLQDQIRSDRSVIDLLTANYTFLNQRLARHYGIPNVYGGHFRKVMLSDERRVGLLGHGSVLTVTSYPNRTSPVVRGKWLLENLLGAAPPPPPPNVPALRENGEGEKATTVRERLEAHRRNPVCASCHAQMDPLGFALENFDAVGKWRTIDQEARTPIDSSGTLPDGTKFNGPVEFRAALLRRRADFVANLSEKLLVYALGRGLEYYDMPVIRGIIRESAAEEYRWSALVGAIVRSPSFQMRLARPAAQAPVAANPHDPAPRRMPGRNPA